MNIFQFHFPISGVETYLFIPPLVAFIMSFVTSRAVISGAFLLLPFQMSVLGFTTPAVSATNFLYNVTGTPGGVYRYASERRFAWPVALLILAGMIPGVLIGYFIRVKYLPDPKTFKLFVGLVLLAIAFKLLSEVRANKANNNNTTCSPGDRVENTAIGMARTRFDFNSTGYAFSTGALLILALGVGVIGGIYGIGGGSIMAPFLITFFKLPVYAVAGAVLLGTFSSSVAGVAFYSLLPVKGMTATPDWLLGLLFGAGGFLGMYCGAKMQRHVSEKWIKFILGGVVLIVASRYILHFFGAL